MAGHHGSPVSPGPLADEEPGSVPEARERFHYGIFHARGRRSSAAVEILSTAPLPITHLETLEHLAVAERRDASRGEMARTRAVSFLLGVASTLSSKLARVAQRVRIRTFR
jgi:hypothetical protein